MPLKLPERNPDRLVQLATDLAVTNNFAFLSHRRVISWVAGASKGVKVTIDGADYEVTAQLTLCNCYTSVFCAALGCPVPPMKANDQIQKYLFANEGQMAGWFKVNRAAAIARAKLGYPTLMCLVAPGHGHIAPVMPSPVTDPNGLYVSAAGRSNFVFEKAIRSFGSAGETTAAEFATHN